MEREMNVLPKRSVKNQYLATLVVSILTTLFGVNIGWITPSIPLLTSDDTLLPSGRITIEEASWLAALLPIGGFIGDIFFGFTTKTLGRKWPLFFLSIPMIISWLLVYFSQNVFYLYIARLLHGFVAGGVVIVSTLYFLEISNDSNRGILSSTVTLCCFLGSVIIFIMGTFCDFHTAPLIIVGFTLLFAILFFFFPETPIFLMKKNRISEAEKSTRFYHNLQGAENCELLQLEMNRLKSAIENEARKCVKGSVKWSDFLTGPARKAMIIGIVLSALNQLCGCFALLNYAGLIFEESGSTLSSNMSMIFVGLIQFIGSTSLLFLVDRAGRKFLYITSTLGTAFGLITLGVYMMLKSWHWNIDAFNWIPLASFSVAIFSASLAIVTLQFTVIGEMMPENIKEYGVTICNSLLSFSAIITLKFLPLIVDMVGFHGSMFVFASVCLLSAVFIIEYMPETKNLSYEQIMKLLE